MWLNFHTTYTAPLQTGDDISESVDSDDEDDEDNTNEEDGVEATLLVSPQQQSWFSKIEPFLNHVNETSKRVCRHPRYALSVDEMMKRFKGRSVQTHRMKNKPIKEGYKFFAICDAQTGFIFDFFPDGRQETTRIATCVSRLIETIPTRNTKKHVVAMDNYFTLPSVLIQSRNQNVGIVGTARNRRGLPPKRYQDITDDRFNSFYVYHHEDDYLICRWIDNNIVNMVTTIHSGDETVTRHRRRPRPTTTNRRHVQNVWGTEAIAPTDIPCVIDDYNHWMLGVDKADQLIAYYRSNLRGRRVWVPILLHCMDIIRINSFIVASTSNTILDHKTYLINFIKAFNLRAERDERPSTRASTASFTSPPGSGRKIKRQRMSQKHPGLPECRLEGDKKDHQEVIAAKQRRCVYCAYVYATAKLQGAAARQPREPARVCLYCNVHVCKERWSIFHGWI